MGSLIVIDVFQDIRKVNFGELRLILTLAFPEPLATLGLDCSRRSARRVPQKRTRFHLHSTSASLTSWRSLEILRLESLEACLRPRSFLQLYRPNNPSPSVCVTGGLFIMAPRRSAATEVQEEEEPQLAVLQFDEPLSWRAGRAIPTAELLRRLETLLTELQEMDQGEVDKESLTKVAKELVGQNLIGHKDKGVRAFAACCLVDVLKICAPDAPFTPSQLKVCSSAHNRTTS